MEIKIKKKDSSKIVKIRGSGKIKEILIKENLVSPKSSKILACFRGKESSGIIEFNPEEIESLYKNTVEKLNLFEDTKIIKFRK